jgi:hypothetical protein
MKMTATAAKLEKGKLVNKGMGGFLCPPGHPMHDWSIETDLRRRPENRGGMCLESAATCEWLARAARGAAKRVLADWDKSKLPVNSAEVQDWIYQVLGYFRGCYKRDHITAPECWNVANLFICQELDPMIQGNDHAGVNLIRRYYPEYVPVRSDFGNAYWGQKPTK